jgi:hypothetical protein
MTQRSKGLVGTISYFQKVRVGEMDSPHKLLEDISEQG